MVVVMEREATQADIDAVAEHAAFGLFQRRSNPDVFGRELADRLQSDRER